MFEVRIIYLSSNGKRNNVLVFGWEVVEPLS